VTSEFFDFMAGDDSASFNSDAVAKLVDFCVTVSKAIPVWMKVNNGHMRSIDLGQEQICANSIVLRSIGVAGCQAMKESPTDWKSIILELSEID
jgi:hypothetical protein